MLNKLKSYLTLISIIIAILTSGYGIYSNIQKNKALAAKLNAETELTVKTRQVVHYKNELGQEVTKTLEYEVYISDLEFSNDSLERQIYRTVKASRIREKDMKEAYAVVSHTENSGAYDEEYWIDVEDSITTIPSTLAGINPQQILVKEFNDGHLKALIYEDSLQYSYDATFILLSGKRRVPRKWQPMKWIGWEWKKTIDKDMVEITSDDTNASFNGRMLKVN